MLVRTRHTPPQTELDRAQRLKNLHGAFTINARGVPNTISSLHILLLDDVMTTGTTLRSAKAALATLRPASITCVALAH